MIRKKRLPKIIIVEGNIYIKRKVAPERVKCLDCKLVQYCLSHSVFKPSFCYRFDNSTDENYDTFKKV